MWALPLLLLSALFSTTVAVEKEEVADWFRRIRGTVDNYFKWPTSEQNDKYLEALHALDDKIAANQVFEWYYRMNGGQYVTRQVGISGLISIIKDMKKLFPDYKHVKSGGKEGDEVLAWWASPPGSGGFRIGISCDGSTVKIIFHSPIKV